jgi:hypothetical protein
MGGTTQVDLYLDPGSTSYACYALTCGGVDQTLVRTITLNAGDDRDIFPGFDAARHVQLRIAGSQGGSGRVTGTPGSPALNCYWNGAALSGTCATDVYWIGTSKSVTFALAVDPDDGTWVCVEYGACSDLNVTRNSQTTIYEPGMTLNVQFYPAKPVTVSVTGQGTVVSKPAGISCPPTCSKWFPQDYAPDDWTEMHATPAAGWAIKDWSGECAGTTGETCQFFNGPSGGSISVVFARLATTSPSHAPTQPPRPTASPRPGVTAPPSAAPGVAPTTGSAAATTPPTGAGSPSPAGLEGSPEPGATVAPGATLTGVAATTIPGGVGNASALTPAPGPVDALGAAAGPELTVLLAVGLAALVILLVIRFALGRRGSRSQGRATP